MEGFNFNPIEITRKALDKVRNVMSGKTQKDIEADVVAIDKKEIEKIEPELTVEQERLIKQIENEEINKIAHSKKL